MKFSFKSSKPTALRSVSGRGKPQFKKKRRSKIKTLGGIGREKEKAMKTDVNINPFLSTGRADTQLYGSYSKAAALLSLLLLHQMSAPVRLTNYPLNAYNK